MSYFEASGSTHSVEMTPHYIPRGLNKDPAVPTTADLTPEQWQLNFDQCLALLKGPSDETR